MSFSLRKLYNISMKKIAITNRFNGKFDTYKNAITSLGGAFEELPKIISIESARKILENFDGLLLTGGGDIDPSFYGEKNTDSFEIIKMRDESEINLVRAAYALDLPTLGICRGIQLANVAFGGTLWQDLEKAGFSNHMKQSKKFELVHEVKSVEKGILQTIFGKTFSANSIHHQGIKELAKGFSKTLLSSDGVIEGIENKSRKFFVFVQFHPEILFDKNDNFKRLFELLLS